MADRLVVDLNENGQVSVSSWREGELTPSPVGEPHAIERPLDGETLEDLRWYVEDYLRASYGCTGSAVRRSPDGSAAGARHRP